MTKPPTMLGYLFWHSPASPSPAYERDLLAFHASLLADPPAGFVRSETAALTAASWLRGDAESYEDWYVVTDWAAVGELNRHAVAATHQASHDRVAYQAGSGVGAIYGLYAGDARDGATVRTWFAKPAGWSYDRLGEALAATLRDGVSLWRRQLVLGPAPEFCLRTDRAVELPAGLGAERIGYRPLA